MSPPQHYNSGLGTPPLQCCPRPSPAHLASCHHLFTELEKSTRQPEARVPPGRGGGGHSSGHRSVGQPWGQAPRARVCGNGCQQLGARLGKPRHRGPAMTQGTPTPMPPALPVATGHTWGTANLSHLVYFPFPRLSPTLAPNVSGHCQGPARACRRGREGPTSVLSGTPGACLCHFGYSEPLAVGRGGRC